LATQKVLVHDMKCIETLARVNVLCVDKTGTITENTMQVNQLIPAEHAPENPAFSLESVISDFAAAMSSDNITMEAMKAYFKKPTGRTAVSITSFSSAFKYSTAAFSDAAY